MLLPCASVQHWPDAEIRHHIRQLHPLRFMLRRPTFRPAMELWYPWYVCAATVTMDTALRRGQVHADRIAVDAVRPVRLRLESVPQRETLDIPEHQTVPLRLRTPQARQEAADLLTSIVINRNKLLLSHDITVEEPELLYFRVLIIPVDGLPETEWLVLEDFFGNTHRLSRRPELKPILEATASTIL